MTVIAMLGQLLLAINFEVVTTIYHFPFGPHQNSHHQENEIHGYQIIHDPDHHAIDMCISLRYIDI